jgi:hypothetical protein
MNKIDLVLHPNEFTSFKSNYLESLFGEYFQFLTFDKTKKYNSCTLFVTNLFGDKAWAKEIKSNGYKVAVDNLWEEPVTTEFYSIQNLNWFWYNESLWYESLGYNNYVPNRTYSKLCFMPINLKKPFRTELIKQLDNYLKDFIYSYNNELPGDNKNKSDWQRYFNANWYDSTYFSLAVETIMTGTGFVTEKTFKPIAFQHPFIVCGQTGVLTFLKNNGFETYNNLFDESYDSIIDNDNRMLAVINCIKNFIPMAYDNITLEKIKHNKNRFFDKNLIISKIKQEIIEPLVEYAET